MIICMISLRAYGHGFNAALEAVLTLNLKVKLIRRHNILNTYRVIIYEHYIYQLTYQYCYRSAYNVHLRSALAVDLGIGPIFLLIGISQLKWHLYSPLVNILTFLSKLFTEISMTG